jgi:hypothetical protein
MRGWKPYVLGGAGLAVLISAAGFHLACGHGRPSTERIRAEKPLGEMVQTLKRRLPDLRVVPARPDGELSSGVYLCDAERRLEELQWMPRSEACAGKWSGVVFCEHVGPLDYVQSGAWGQNGLQVGPFLFFGDAKLIARIRDALRRPPRAGKRLREKPGDSQALAELNCAV